jgi:hypothetical protein
MGEGLYLAGIGAGAVADTAFAASAIAPINNGNRVQRADALIAQAAAVQSLFTVTGVVEIKTIYGVVGTVIGSVANATKLQAKATGQTAVDLCATLDINALAAGKIFTITGVLATAATAGFAAVRQTTPLIVQAGTIDLNCAGNSVTGTMRWVVYYIPLEIGSTLTST